MSFVARVRALRDSQRACSSGAFGGGEEDGEGSSGPSFGTVVVAANGGVRVVIEEWEDGVDLLAFGRCRIVVLLITRTCARSNGWMRRSLW